jgi:exodeoxyribonuclease VII small subunit
MLRECIMTQKFEDLMRELKEILARIEDNQTGLDEAIVLYERGSILIRQAEEILSSAEMKISMVGRE